jgi:hypothetical protein
MFDLPLFFLALTVAGIAVLLRGQHVPVPAPAPRPNCS